MLVRVEAAALNPIDIYIRAGTVAMPLPMPFITGCDLAGTVEAVGPGVQRFKVGDRVWGSNQGLLGRQGTFAEYAGVDEDWLYPTPAGVSDDAGRGRGAGRASRPTSACSAAPDCKPGETVFVNGGTGGVGSMVVQMAKAVGARVITTVGSDGEGRAVPRAGAPTCVLNYKTDDVPAGVKRVHRRQGRRRLVRDAARAGLRARRSTCWRSAAG